MAFAQLYMHFQSRCLQKLIDCQTLQTLLKLVSEINNFEFNGKHFVLVNGTSMGAKIDPNYANIFMGIQELEFLESGA